MAQWAPISSFNRLAYKAIFIIGVLFKLLIMNAFSATGAFLEITGFVAFIEQVIV